MICDLVQTKGMVCHLGCRETWALPQLHPLCGSGDGALPVVTPGTGGRMVVAKQAGTAHEY
jgi:hypothetical protein